MKKKNVEKQKIITKTKIIATIGPSSLEKRVLGQMVLKGMDCARINTAHGDFLQYKKIIRNLREIDDIPVMLDIKGPEIRIKTKEDISIKSEGSKNFFFMSGCNPYFSHDFSNILSEGDVIFFDNGSIKSSVKFIKKGKDPFVTLSFRESCTIKPNKGVNIPGKKLDIPALSSKDRQAVAFAVKNSIDFLALSFTRTKKDIINVRKLLKKSGIAVIAKIENQEGINNIDEIIDACDGIMIARGDLGVEVTAEKIPFLQKMIIQKCNSAGKIVIVATQMLESMVHSPTPTRAEVSDVANAIIDGADAMMLSGETASGAYPVKSVEIMEKIAKEIEDKTHHEVMETKQQSMSNWISSIANTLAQEAKATKIVCLSRSGFSARLISRFRPKAPIIAATDSHKVLLQLKLVWGVFPVLIKSHALRSSAGALANYLCDYGFLKRSDKIVFVGGKNTLIPMVSNFVEIHDIDDLLNYFKRYLKK